MARPIKIPTSLQCIACAAVFALTAPFTSQAADQRPNVIWIVADDLNDSLEGLGGHPDAIAPNLQKLTKTSVQFTNAHCSYPLCAPSRASFLTGISPNRSGYYGIAGGPWNFQFRNPVLANSRSVFQHFRQNGYEVYGTGKDFHYWDLQHWLKRDGSRGDGIYQSHNFGIYPSWGPFPWDGASKDKNGCPIPVVHPSNPAGIGSYERGFGPLSDVPDVPPNPSNGTPGYKGWMTLTGPFRYENETDRDLLPDEQNTQWAIEQLKKTRDEPFFLYVGYNRPHTPMYVPKKFFDLFDPDKLQLPPYLENDRDDTPGIIDIDTVTGTRKEQANTFRQHIAVGGEKLWKQWLQAYLAGVAFVDDEIGKLLNYLAEAGLSENTIVIVTSDHGYHMGEKDYLFKNTLWSESTRVPLIIRAPGVSKPGGVCAIPVSLLDIFPTLNELCRLPPEPNAGGNGIPLDGLSLVPLLKDPTFKDWPREGVLTTVASFWRERETVTDPDLHHHSVRTMDWRYTRMSDGEEELYHVSKDPNEWSNLAGNEKYSEKKRELNQLLTEMLAKERGPQTPKD